MLQKLERKDSFSHTEDGICNINFNINSGFHAKSFRRNWFSDGSRSHLCLYIFCKFLL